MSATRSPMVYVAGAPGGCTQVSFYFCFGRNYNCRQMIDEANLISLVRWSNSNIVHIKCINEKKWSRPYQANCLYHTEHEDETIKLESNPDGKFGFNLLIPSNSIRTCIWACPPYFRRGKNSSFWTIWTMENMFGFIKQTPNIQAVLLTRSIRYSVPWTRVDLIVEGFVAELRGLYDALMKVPKYNKIKFFPNLHFYHWLWLFSVHCTKHMQIICCQVSNWFWFGQQITY